MLNQISLFLLTHKKEQGKWGEEIRTGCNLFI